MGFNSGFKGLNIHFDILATNTPTCFDLLQIIFKEFCIKQTYMYIQHRWIIESAASVCDGIQLPSHPLPVLLI